jgi:YaiO family outer membrane protein
MRRAHLFVIFLAVVLGSATTALAQTTDAIAHAKALETSGKRAEAIQVLRTRLAASPGDDDPREILGIYLSWEGKYDEARTLLTVVVDHRPKDLDALAALMNVELWSAHYAAARQRAEQGVSAAHADERFKTGLERALNNLAATLPWTVSASVARDTFSDQRDAWHETQVSLKRYTPVGTAMASVVRARRFGLNDTQYQLDLYPKFRPGTYAYVSVGVAPDKVLFPHVRIGADLYQSIGGGFELSAGFRRLEFSTPTTMYVGSVSKYLGDWLLTGRVYHVPDRTGASSTSYHGSARRYFGGDGTSYVGARYSHGFAREEVVSINDFEVLGSDTFAADMDVAVGRRWRLVMQGSTSSQESLSGISLRQNTLLGGLSFRF